MKFSAHLSHLGEARNLHGLPASGVADLCEGERREDQFLYVAPPASVVLLLVTFHNLQQTRFGVLFSPWHIKRIGTSRRGFHANLGQSTVMVATRIRIVEANSKRPLAGNTRFRASTRTYNGHSSPFHDDSECQADSGHVGHYLARRPHTSSPQQ